jgi:hypothetical protein
VSVWLNVVVTRRRDVPGWSLQLLWRDSVHQLRCRLRVSCGRDVTDSCVGDVPCRHVQLLRRNVVYELQRRLRVPGWIDDRDARRRSLWRRQVLSQWWGGVSAVLRRQVWQRHRGCSGVVLGTVRAGVLLRRW